MSIFEVSPKIIYVGASDAEQDLFEGQYILEKGMAYNSYLIKDEKTALIDCTDERVGEQFLKNVELALDGRALDYVVVQHLEPDHSGMLERVLELYPGARVVLSAKALSMAKCFVNTPLEQRAETVSQGDSLCLGEHELSFIAAPMVHWPEVIVSYDKKSKTLFSADAFGKFGAFDADEDWACEARRYYFNIVGKYGAQVQSLLKKAAALDIKTICPLHGPILTKGLERYIGLYDKWSRYEPEVEGVFIAYASLHGHTAQVALDLAQLLRAKGCPKVAVADLSREDIAECVEDAFKYSKVVLAASSYDAGVMPKMHELLAHLKSKNYQNRTVALIENTCFAPSALRTMKAELAQMKNITVLEPEISVKVRPSEENLSQLGELAAALI